MLVKNQEKNGDRCREVEKSTAADRLCDLRRGRVVSEVVGFFEASDRIHGGRKTGGTLATLRQFDRLHA